jgi:hypothetical protein
MPELSADPMIEVTPVGASSTGVVDGPTLILRPRLVFRLAGPVLIVVGALGAAAGYLAAALIALVGIVAVVAWVHRIVVNDREIVIRGLTSSTSLPIRAIGEIRLRRVHLGPKHALHRSFRFGPFSSTPMRLYFLGIGGDTLARITVVYWDGWAGLVRYLLAIPIDSDSRTHGRLERYG